MEWDGCDGISGLVDDICKDSPSPDVSIFASPPITSVTVGITFGNLGKVFGIWILWIRGVAGRQIPPQSTLQLLTSDLSMNNFVLMHLGLARKQAQMSHRMKSQASSNQPMVLYENDDILAFALDASRCTEWGLWDYNS